MDITLEKVELVKDRTGVSYKEAKEALEQAEGSVVDAIIKIEETINQSAKSKVSDQVQTVVDKIKEAVAKGNVSRIVVKKDDEIILNLPVNVGIIGTALSPLVAVAGVVAAFGLKCKIELIKDDGEVIDISEKAEAKFDDVSAKGQDLAGTIKDKSSDVIDNIKKAGTTKVKPQADAVKDKVDEMWEKAKAKAEGTANDAEDAVDDLADQAEDVADDLKDKAEDVVDAAKEKVLDAADAVKDESNEI
ncbi:MAG: DUF4342 domain-containing protein [Clostridiales Family XIII bacterium]|jgi:gas vesicle protein|nr:DUF4342 domain-containing protein [Clostridiales Family XIII bacterium]